MPAEVPDVAEEDIGRAQEHHQRQGEHVLDGGDHRDEDQPRADVARVEQHQERAQRDQAEREAPDAARDRGKREDDLRELDLLDDLFLGRHRGDAIADAAGEPFPGQDRGEDEEGIPLRPVADHDRDEHDIDDHLEKRVKDPPDVAQEGVRALLGEVCLDQVPNQALTRSDLPDRFADEADRAPAGEAPESVEPVQPVQQ